MYILSLQWKENRAPLGSAFPPRHIWVNCERARHDAGNTTRNLELKCPIFRSVKDNPVLLLEEETELLLFENKLLEFARLKANETFVVRFLYNFFYKSINCENS